MTIRGQFQLDLESLQKKLLKLGKLADEALKSSVEALETKNIDLALKVMENDTEVDVLYEEIHDFAILLIAKQSPVAIDLRRIIVAIKIATDIERIADYAVNIAKATIRIGKEEHVLSLDTIKKMYEISSKMLSLSLKAFNDEDVAQAKQIADMDDEVDDLYGVWMHKLLSINQQHPEYMPQMTQLSLVCRYLERTGDRVTNISENIFYLVKGKHYALNE